MKRFLVIILFLIGIILNLPAQIKGELKENFYWGETFILYEEYRDALPLYQLLLKVNPLNSNYKYRIGQCLLNIPGRKQEAISYLEEAVKDINPGYRQGSFRETHAPLDAYYYLANAYRINNQLEKAIETYQIFKKNLNPKVYDTTIVNMQIESCLNALEITKVPLYIKKINSGNNVNNQYSDFNPVVSADESIMVFNRSEPFQEAIYFTKKVDGKWSEPVNLIPFFGLGFEDKNYATSISADGIELYIYRAGSDYTGNLYVTRRKDDDTWTGLIKLNDNINTKYWESHASMTHDGKRLYFTSNRKGSYGGLDIYYSDRDTTGDWGVARNIGPVINTRFNEDCPFILKDGKTLFFSSQGHFNIGGYDIFYSTLLENGEWSVPLNVGYPLNTTDDDLFFQPLNDGYKAYYAMIGPDTYGLTDIYRIEIYSENHPRKFYIRGIVKVQDLLSMFGDSIKVTAINKQNPDSKVIVYSNPITGEYIFDLLQGDYTLTFEGENAAKVSKDIELSLFSPFDTLQVADVQLPKLDLISEIEILTDKTISTNKGDTVSIPIRTEKDAILVIEKWLGDSLLSSEQHILRDSLFIYKFLPATGENRVTFKLTDKYGNITDTEVMVTMKKIEEKIIRPEYKHIIARRQVDSFIEMLKNNAEGDLLNLLQTIDFSKQQFAKAEDILTFIKKEASKVGIDDEEVDKLALKTAVTGNVLSQAAIDIMARYSTCLLKKILEELDIYEAKIQTWADFQKYLAEHNKGKITSENLNRLAMDIIRGLDPVISILRDQILAYSEISGKTEPVENAVRKTDAKNITAYGAWLKDFFNEAIENKLSKDYLAGMFAALTTLPGTELEDYLKWLKECSTPAFAAFIDAFEPEKHRIHKPEEFVRFLIDNRKKNLFNEDDMFSSMAAFIANIQISRDKIIIPEEEKRIEIQVFWVILGAGLIFFIIFFLKKRKKKS